LRRKAPRRRLCPVKTACQQGGKAALPARGKGFGPKALFLLALRQCAGF